MYKCRVSMVVLVALAMMVSALSGCGCFRKGLIRINGEKIMKEEYFDRVERVIVPGQGGNRMVGDLVMRKMIADKLVLQYAEKKGVAPTEQQIERQLKLAKRIEGGDLQRKLQQQGLTMVDFKRELETATAQLNIMGKGITVPESKIKEAYQKLKAANPSPYRRSQQVKISIIMTSTKAKADNAYQMLKSDKDFGTVARQISELQDAKQSGGEIPEWVARDDKRIPQPVRDTAYSLDIKEHSKPFEVIDSKTRVWAIVRVDRKRPAMVIPYDEVKDIIRDQLRAQERGRKNGKKVISDLQRFIKDSDITINHSRYESLPGQIKKQAGEVLKNIEKMPEPGAGAPKPNP